MYWRSTIHPARTAPGTPITDNITRLLRNKLISYAGSCSDQTDAPPIDYVNTAISKISPTSGQENPFNMVGQRGQTVMKGA